MSEIEVAGITYVTDLRNAARAVTNEWLDAGTRAKGHIPLIDYRRMDAAMLTLLIALGRPRGSVTRGTRANAARYDGRPLPEEDVYLTACASCGGQFPTFRAICDECEDVADADGFRDGKKAEQDAQVKSTGSA